ncbi:MAG: MFS transporter [Promethearchaeota archaeon]
MGKIKQIFQEYPKSFWVLAISTFVDRLGSYLLYPFFGFYIRARFSVDYTGVGLLFSMLAIGGIIGGIAGGAIADKLGRRIALLSGLIGSAITTLCMGFVDTLNLFYVFAFLNGVLGDLGHPGRQAMVTDLLPTNKRSEGFAIMRIFANLSAMIGPALGGFISATTNKYLILFIADVVSSSITAVIIFLVIPETKPKIMLNEAEDNKKEKIKKKFGSTLMGYFQVFKDWQFMLFIVVGILSTWVYMQFNTTLPVFLLDEHGFSEFWFGILLSSNALTVVLCQFWISRFISKYPPMIFMAIGVTLYGFGFVLFGFVSASWLFFVAIGVVTIGEMISAPFIMAAAGRFAPEDMRGRYMAISGWRRIVPRLFGIILAGYIIDTSASSSLIWYIVGIVAIIAMLGYMGLHKITKKRFAPPKMHE